MEDESGTEITLKKTKTLQLTIDLHTAGHNSGLSSHLAFHPLCLRDVNAHEKKRVFCVPSQHVHEELKRNYCRLSTFPTLPPVALNYLNYFNLYYNNDCVNVPGNVLSSVTFAKNSLYLSSAMHSIETSK
uniref:Uncharacterized protein n=1 Tax=Glossina austeni TaxID=7395 RepID=A0A1A9VQT6_GLOAU